MTEENILILNLLREGKITAEQADSLLRAVRDNGAAHPMRPADYASALAGKIMDTLPKPDLDIGRINKAVDEAMRGLSSLKNEALRTAKTAARQAVKFEFHMGSDSESPRGRPENSEHTPEAAQISRDSIAWTGADKLLLENHYGNIKVTGAEMPRGTAEATMTKTAWAGSEAEAQLLLQQVFLTHQVENGRCKIGVAAPREAAGRLTVDCEIWVPRTAPLEVLTTYGEVAAQAISQAFTVNTASGAIEVSEARTKDASGEMHLSSHSGNIRLADWNAPTGSVFAETGSGGIELSQVTGESIRLTNRSGGIHARSVQAETLASLESIGGDVSIAQSTAKSHVQLRTQSGQAKISDTQAEQIQIETVSGDIHINGTVGALTVKTLSGEVSVTETDSPAISLVSVSGDVRWNMQTPFSGAFAGTTVSGDLHLTLPTSSDSRIEMNTATGALTLNLPVTDAALTGCHAEGTLGAGTGRIHLQSVSGSLIVSDSVSQNA